MGTFYFSGNIPFERRGFEPLEAFTSLAYQASTIDHSATSGVPKKDSGRCFNITTERIPLAVGVFQGTDYALP